MLLGAVMGVLFGQYAFLGMVLFWWAEVRPGLWTIALYLLGLVLILAANSLLWPQLVLFRIPAASGAQPSSASRFTFHHGPNRMDSSCL